MNFQLNLKSASNFAAIYSFEIKDTFKINDVMAH